MRGAGAAELPPAPTWAWAGCAIPKAAASTTAVVRTRVRGKIGPLSTWPAGLADGLAGRLAPCRYQAVMPGFAPELLVPPFRVLRIRPVVRLDGREDTPSTGGHAPRGATTI